MKKEIKTQPASHNKILGFCSHKLLLNHWFCVIGCLSDTHVIRRAWDLLSEKSEEKKKTVLKIVQIKQWIIT